MRKFNARLVSLLTKQRTKMKFTIHITESLESYLDRELRCLEEQYGGNPAYFSDTLNPDTAFDIGFYIALKRVKLKLKQ